MFYNSTERTYRILGVYHLTRSETTEGKEDGRPFAALAFRLRGKSNFFVDGKQYIADEKSILYIPSGVGYTRTGKDEEIIILHLACNGADDTELGIFHADGAQEEFEALLHAWQADGTNEYNRCMSLLYRIFERIEKSVPNVSHASPETIAKGVQYLNEHYRDTDLNIAYAASLCHVSEVWFRRSYHTSFGVSPWQDILNRRFAHARTLLQSGYYSIKEVALQSGFSDVKYFRTAFSKRYGITPSAYAHQARNHKQKEE